MPSSETGDTPAPSTIKNPRPEPIALISMGCRFPGGATTPELFWKLLSEGRDAIVDIPADRWDLRRYHDSDSDLPGKSHARQGGFLQEPIDAFDAAFFGFSPREAETLDPQQRLLLETAWETFERAGQPLERLQGSATGVFIGGFCLDNQVHRLANTSAHLIDAFTATSSSLTLLSNRISYLFDLRGPSLSLDTACSSSLVAVHLACRSLWQGECTQALAGGVNVMLRPEFAVAMSKGGFLSRHSRSRAFDDRADGYARGEGAGLVLLKPLADAQRDGDPVIAVIRMTGVNQDGRSAGITSPNGAAQQALMRQVCADAGVRPRDIVYVEAHGTGTQAGDGTELRSLDAVLRDGRPAGDRCWVGAVKTNIGHLEAAAGVAALIKAALVLQHRQVPPNLHLQVPNRSIDFQSLCLKFPNRIESLDTEAASPLAAVNAFGYGGTNAHVLLEAAPHNAPAPAPPDEQADESSGPHLLPLSARDPAALRELARAHARRRPADLTDWIHTTAFRRSHLEHRLVALGDDAAKLERALTDFADGVANPTIVSGRAPTKPVKPVFVFTGMGPQWWAMGRELYASEPAFRAAWDEAVEAFDRCSGWSLMDALGSDEASSRIAQTAVAQPANFVLQIALAALWRDLGVTPAAVVGHSAGEVAAACVAGALSVQAGAAVCFHRSRLQQRLSGTGAMLALGLGEDETRERLSGFPGIEVAAVNAPASVTLAGPREQLETFAARLPKTVFQRFLRVDVPYHSAGMDMIQAELLSSLDTIESRPPVLPFISTVTGLPWSDALDAGYWWQNVRQPVRFAEAIAALGREGHGLFLEIGPHPVLAESVQQVLSDSEHAPELVASLVRREPEARQVRHAIARLHTSGVAINWTRLVPSGGRFASLPTYPWRRDRYWSESAAGRLERIGTRNHAFLYHPLASPQPAWQVDLNSNFFPYLTDHRVGGAVVFPGAAYLEAGLVLHRHLFGTTACVLEGVQFERMLVRDAKRPATLVLSHDPATRRFNVHSRLPVENAEWLRHAQGQLRHLPEAVPPAALDLASLRRACAKTLSPLELYRRLEQQGLGYGPWFRTVRALSLGTREAVAHLKAHPQVAGSRSDVAHPTLVDGALQVLIALINSEDTDALLLPASVARVRCHESLPRECWAHARVIQVSPALVRADIRLAAGDGRVLLELEGVELAAMPAMAMHEKNPLIHTLEWREIAAAERARDAGNFIIVGGDETLRELLTAAFVEAGGTLVDNVANLPEGGLLIYLGTVPHGSTDGPRILQRSLDLLQILQAAPATRRIRVVVTTHLAQIVTGDEASTSLEQMPWEGLIRVAANETGGWDYRLVDLDLRHAESAAPLIVQEALCGDRSREVAYRNGRRHRREVRALAAPPLHAPPRFREGTYLVTGGTRGFGRAVARWLAELGATRLVLASRSGEAAPGAAEARRELEAAGAEVIIHAVDVSDLSAVRALLEGAGTAAAPLRGIFHGAMVLDDAPLHDQDAGRFSRVFAPKLQGALHLHRLTLESNLDYFVCFSSISSLLGNPAQANYAAANAFLDGLAQYRRRHGLPGLSLNFGLLGETGVAHENQDVRRLLETVGIHGLPTAEVLQAMGVALGSGRAQLGIFRMDWTRWTQAFPGAADDDRFASVLGRNMEAGGPQSRTSIVTALRNLPPHQRRETLERELRSRLGMVLRLSPDDLDPGKELRQIGIDSLSMVELITTVNREFGVQLSAVDILRNPTIRQLAEALLARLLPT